MALFFHAVRGLRGQVLAYGLGLAFWGVVEAALFPTVRDTLAAVEYPEELLKAFGATSSNLSDPRTFMDVEFFSLGPLVLAVFALFAGTGALAGEESRGTMEVLAALPVSRRRMFFEKVLAVTTALVLTCAIVALGWVLAMPFAEFGRQLPLWRLTAATFAMLSFAGFVVASALLLGAVAPSRGAAGAWGAALLIASYLIVVISGVTESVEDLRYLSPYYYSDLTGILAQGAEWEHQVALWSATVLTGWLGLRAFEGRELGAERWQYLAPLRGGPGMVATTSMPVAERASAWLGRRSRRWWAGAVAALVLLGATGGAVAGAISGAGSDTRAVVADGWVEAPSARVLAPVSGTIRSIGVRDGDDVSAGQDIGWVENALDGSLVPIRAPLAGRVSQVSSNAGEFVVAGTPMTTVHQLDRLYVLLEVGERDIDAVAPGQRISVTLTAPGTEFDTYVESVGRVALTGDGVRSRDEPKYEVRSTALDVDGGVAPGMVVDARIHVPAR
ncbi:MAG: ABC transporter permease subunit [Dehalococcoidia bacterium]|nr:ABC transporter permease subunit [Dehalococcoidia bacterium]